MKKVLAILLCLVLAIGTLSACGAAGGSEAPKPAESEAASSEAKPESEAASSEAASEAPAEESTPEPAEPAKDTWLCDEKTTLTVYTWEGTSSTMLPPSNDLYFWKFMEDYTNVHIEWDVQSYDNYETLVSAKLTGGVDLPDIILVGRNLDIANEAGENGLLVDLGANWNEWFPYTNAYLEKTNNTNYKKALTNADGTQYVLASQAEPEENHIMACFNTKWMQELGLEIPKTIEEFEAVLQAFKDAGDLNGNGAADEIPLTTDNLDQIRAYLDPTFGIEAYIREAGFQVGDDGVVYDTYTNDNEKAMFAYLNGLYSKGLLDAEVTTNTRDIVMQKVTAERVGCFIFYCGFAITYGALLPEGQADPTGEHYTVGVPLASEWNENPYLLRHESYGTFTGVTTSCENPELAAKWLDVLMAEPWVLQTRVCGIEGQTYEVAADGSLQPIAPADGSTWTVNDLGCGQIALPYFQTKESLTFDKVIYPWFLAEYQNIRDNYEFKNASITRVPTFTPEEQEVRDLYWTDLEASWKEYRDKFIIGELDTEKDWDAYKKTLDGFGLQEMIGVYQSVYDRTK